MKNNPLLFLLFLFLAFMTACAGSATLEQETTVEPYNKTNAINAVRDPSLKKCLNDGYSLRAIRKAGLVQSYLCVNTISDKKCDSWAYFRGECPLKKVKNKDHH